MFLKNILLGIGGTAAVGGIGYGIYASQSSNGEEGNSNADDKTETDTGEQTGSEQTQPPANPAPAVASTSGQETQKAGQDTGK